MIFVEIDMGDRWYYINPALVTKIHVSKDMRDCIVYTAHGMVYNHGASVEGTKAILEKFKVEIE